jgi:uncharacterized alkaline shock family protein YloU
VVKILDRFLLFIYSLFVLIAAATILLAVFSLIPVEHTNKYIESVCNNNSLAYSVIGISVLLILISIRFLYVSLRRSRAQASFIDMRTEHGEICISLETVENLSLKAAGRVKGIKDLRARIKVNEAGLHIALRTTIDGDRSIPEMTEEMQNAVKLHVEEVTGVPVADVSVFVVNIIQSAPTFKSRVE